MTSAVADAGPVIHLAEIRACRLLGVFDQLHIPHAVELETIGQGRVSLNDLAELTNLHWYQTALAELSEFVQYHSLGNLQAGGRTRSSRLMCSTGRLCSIDRRLSGSGSGSTPKPYPGWIVGGHRSRLSQQVADSCRS